MSELSIVGGQVLDGTGSGPRDADLGIENGRITEIGAGISSGATTLDARGMLVIPGVIDVHTHDDFTLPLRPEATARVRQGVTTTVTGNCGFSPFPLDDSPAAIRHGAFFESALDRRWRDLSEFASDVDSLEPGINVAPLVGLGAVRLAVIGEDDSPPGDAGLLEMRRLVSVALEQGAFGGSSGLVYAPGCYADTNELVAMAEEIGAAGGFYATHMRDEARELEASVAESIEIGHRASCPTHISHHKAIGRENWGKVERTLELVDEANSRGDDVSLDAYPYVAGSSTLLSLIPPEHQDGGVDAVRAKLSNRDGRRRLVEAISEERVFALADVVLAFVPSRPQLAGLRLSEAAARAACTEAELVADLIAEDGVDVVMVAFGMDEADVATVLGHPRSMVGSDGWVLATDASPSPHPRNFSTTARFLTAFVRDRSLIGLPEAVRKLTSLPADRLGMADRGRLEPGAVADIAVIDYEQLRDLATFEQPCAYPLGFEHVLVNGVPVLEAGELTGARPGRVLARAGAGGHRP